MTPIEQFRLALEFMLLGMGVVFAFLTILVFIVQWMGIFIQKIENRGLKQGITVDSEPAESDVIVAVISAAVHRYRADHF